MDIRRSNRRALLAFVSVLVLFLVLGGSLLLIAQRQILAQDSANDLDAQLSMLGDLAAESLLRSDYVSFARLIVNWGQQHDDVLLARALGPNEFELARYARGLEQPSLIRRQAVSSNGRLLGIIEVSKSASFLHEKVGVLYSRFLVAALIFISVMGWFLWRTMRRNGLTPLREEIARRERSEIELRRRTQLLEAANKELDAFSYSVSHDLRAPLRAIDGFSQVLKEDYAEKLDAAGQEYLRRVCAATQRMGELIDDLLRLSRCSTQELAVTDIDLSALAGDIAQRLRQSDPMRRVLFDIEPGISARGDARLMRSVLENILGNAWKYTSKKPEAIIKFGTLRQAGETVYYVGDNGVGFDMAYAGKLFGAFQRLHKPEDFPGAGIGLALTMRIVLRHGGRIWVEAQPEQGATFFFTLGE